MTSQRRGYCPSVWMPMQSGDGLIVRVQAGAIGLSSQNIRDLTRFAAQYGNGQLELTRRANVQLRGVAEASLAALQSALVDHGLAQPTAELEARMVLTVDPLSDIDPACASLAALCVALREALARATGPLGLPSKFGVLLDAGSGALNHVAADIRLRVCGEEPDRVWLYAAGDAHDAVLLGACRDVDAASALMALLSMLAGTRMRESIARQGTDAVRARLSEWLVPSERAAPPPAPVRPLIGYFRSTASGYVGMALPFGSADVDQLGTLAELADTYAARQVRVTASRSVLLPGVAAECAAELIARARAAGFITDGQDPLLRAVACPGTPRCASAAGETRAWARRLVQVARPLFDAHITLHVSGCQKSCALSGSAELSLVHSERGVHLGFDCDAASAAAQPVASIAEVEARLARLSRDSAHVAAAAAPVGVG